MEGFRDRIIGMFLGTAIGDALGMPVETMTMKQISDKYGKISSYIDPDQSHKWYGGKLKAGMWTDDTQLTLAIAKSLIKKGAIGMDDIIQEHIKAMDESDIGWGRSTLESVQRLKNGVHWSMSGNIGGAGNGVVMKISPIAAFFAKANFGLPEANFKDCVFPSEYLIGRVKNAYKQIVQVTLMTHCSDMACTSSVLQLFLLELLLRGRKLEEFYYISTAIFLRPGQEGESDTLEERVCRLAYAYFSDWDEMIVEDDFLDYLASINSVEKSLELFGGATCYVKNSLPFTYSCFFRNPRNIEAMYEAVNAGGDTDTNASMVGALLGANNGTKIFPDHLIDGLWRKEEILKIANDFCDRFKITD